jgi:hypothetical protein
MKNILLLTSTVRPKPGQPSLALHDPEARLQEYRNALAFNVDLLLRGTVDAIVYADNSGFDLSPLKSAFPSGSIEWISFYDLDYDPGYHRGYGEFRLIDHAYRVSRVLPRCALHDRVWKVTGRYVVKNFSRIVELTPKNYDLFCEVRAGWAEMSVMAWNQIGYQAHIRDFWQQLTSDMAPELLLAERLRQAGRGNCRTLTNPYWPPFLIGRRGSDGSPFQGRWTRARFSLTAAIKLAQLPLRWARHAGDRFTPP